MSAFNRAPQDCTQYFTGASGTIQSYNFAGNSIIQGMDYTNCVRQELGMALNILYVILTIRF